MTGSDRIGSDRAGRHGIVGRTSVGRASVGRRSGLLVVCVLAGLPLQALALRVDYSLGLTAEHNDNLLVTPTDPVAVTLLRPSVGFGIHHDSSTLQARITGRAEARRYDDDRFENTIDGVLTGRLNWVIAPQRLSFSAIDSLTIQPVNTLGADTPGNRQQVNVFSAGPSLQFNLSPSWRGAAELHYVRSEAEITDEFNSSRIDLAVHTIKRLGTTGQIALNVQAQQVDFDDEAIARDYDRADVFVRYSKTLARFDYAFEAGYSQLSYRRDRPGFARRRGDPLARVEFGWHPNESHALSIDLSSEFSDVVSDTLRNATPDIAPPENVDAGGTVVNASPFLETRLDTEYAYTATRWNFSVSPHMSRLRYGETDEFDQNGVGAGLEAGWRARRNLRVGVTGSFVRNRYVNLDRTDETRRYAAFVRYDWARRWTGMLQFGRYERASTSAGQNAAQNLITLTFSYDNR